MAQGGGDPGAPGTPGEGQAGSGWARPTPGSQAPAGPPSHPIFNRKQSSLLCGTRVCLGRSALADATVAGRGRSAADGIYLPFRP